MSKSNTSYHNGGFPPIYEGGQKEVIQREFSPQNILSINQILNNNKPAVIVRREKPVVYKLVDKKPVFKNKK